MILYSDWPGTRGVGSWMGKEDLLVSFLSKWKWKWEGILSYATLENLYGNIEYFWRGREMGQK